MLYPSIEAERARAGMTKLELCNHLDITPKTLINWQSGKTSIPISKVIKLSQMFQCSTDYLLGLDEVRRKESA